MLLKDKVAIVTGGTKGIGRAISLLFAEEGARVVANFSKDVEAAEALINEAKSKRLNLGLFKADVTRFDQVKEMVEDVFAEYSRIDILVNNVGLIRDNFLMLMSDDDWDSLLKNNLTSLFYCCKAVIRKMIPQRNGKIVNISSISGILGTAGQTNYAATKGGMISFTKSLARELGSFNIHVNAIAPGLIESEVISKMPKEKVEAIIKSSSLGRMGKPEEVAQAVLFLASEHSNYITGQTLIVDGGIV
ncbi:MAG: beta-ketoacyl-ACP reductase [Thermodesulfobacteriota bacterium]|nr:beta-ketoacyl-ACP reductase [Thermodesulfobacteriota bacterium]